MSPLCGTMKYYIGNRDAVEKLFEELKASVMVVYGPKVKNGSIVYGELNSINEIPLGVGGISSLTHHSVKEVAHPPVQDYIVTEGNYTSYLASVGVSSWALFGVRPCDVSSIKILDALLSDDPIYRQRRERLLWIVAEECLEVGPYCFCGSLETGPSATEGFDISYAFIGRDCVLFRSGTERGDELLSRIPVREIDGESSELRFYEKKVEEGRKKAVSETLAVRNGFGDALDRSMHDAQLWRKLSESCLGCSNCNMVCPTCSCTEFIDDLKMDGSAKRSRLWVGCLSPVYGQIAGMHFRKEQYMRYRHFVLHKFLFSSWRIKRNACVGCGRCIAFCPMGIDLRKSLEEVLSSYGRK
ncbi:MAG: 4Fe-4S dicluster domain-containing protein [Fervidicoccaceae archaeon]